MYVGSGDGLVYAFDGENGRILWTFPTDGVIDSSPALDDTGTLYIGSEDGRVYAIPTGGAGLCTTCPWPKLAHDNRNTGFAGTPLE